MKIKSLPGPCVIHFLFDDNKLSKFPFPAMLEPCGNTHSPRNFTHQKSKFNKAIQLLTTIVLQRRPYCLPFYFWRVPVAQQEKLRHRVIGPAACLLLQCLFAFARVFDVFASSLKPQGKNEGPSRNDGHQVFPLTKALVEKILRVQWAGFLKLFWVKSVDEVGPFLNIRSHAET